MYFGTDRELNIERVVLERFKFFAQASIDDSFLQDVEVYQMADRLAHQTVLRFKADILGQKLNTVKYPANWKEAFKERWAPKWFLKKYPVKYSYIEVKALYPQLHLPPDQQRPVFHVMKAPKWEV